MKAIVQPKTGGRRRETVYDSTAKPVAEAVVTAVATADGCDPTAVQPPLYKVADPDALNILYQRTALQVTFDYAGHQIPIRLDQTISIGPSSG